jgi:hypothetical protein
LRFALPETAAAARGEEEGEGEGRWAEVVANLVVFPVHYVSTAQLRVHAGEDVFREVESLGRLREPALRHEHQLVHHVRVAVVVPANNRGEGW